MTTQNSRCRIAGSLGRLEPLLPPSLVGNCVVFNIGGNKYRLVTRILYPSQKVFILRVMTHEQYDDEYWKEECGCHQPPPKKAPPLRKAPARPSTRQTRKGK